MVERMISLIVPIYKTAEYLRKCVDSILAQTYTNLQVILVNDGSPDDSLRICREYEEADSRVIVVDKLNGGLSSARNAGLEMVSGEFVGFVDSDDYLEHDAYKTLMEKQRIANADIVYMGTIIRNEFYELVSKINYVNAYINFSGREYMKNVCLRKQSCSVCGAVFKSEIFSGYRFRENRLNEDYLILSEILLDKELKVSVTDYCGYNYLVRRGSISRQGLGKSSKDAVYNGLELKERAALKKSDLIPFIGAYTAYQARTALMLIPYRKIEKHKEFVEVCQKAIKDNLSDYYFLYKNKFDYIFCRIAIVNAKAAIGLYRLYKGIIK